MIQGLRFASIWSEDLNNLLPFYRDTLGLPVGMESPDFVIFGDCRYNVGLDADGVVYVSFDDAIFRLPPEALAGAP